MAKLKGRTGHRLVRLNDSLFVMGGVDKKGLLSNELQRINCHNQRIDTLIMDNTLNLEGFALFTLQESIYAWGGLSNSHVLIVLSQHQNNLLHFDGNKFIHLKQHGSIPEPRADPLYTTFANKYLIFFAGHNSQEHFKDWYLLNIKTLTWKCLQPSLPLNYASHGSMTWVNGRGILLLNDVFD